MSDPRNDQRPPIPPERPAQEDCCHSGCDDCVFNRYYDLLERYEADLASWTARRQAEHASTPQAKINTKKTRP